MTELPDIADVQARADRVLADELYWFPVRHHSPAVARHLQAAIRARRPKLVLIEGPAHASELIRHVVDSKTRPPIALYSSYRDDDNVLGLAGVASPAPDIPARFPVWYPLLAYSPEYVAMVEAAALGAAAVFIDLPAHALIDPKSWADADDEPRTRETSWEDIAVETTFYRTMARVAGYRSWDEAWDALFEIGHRHADHEAFRRDLAYFCGAVRATTPAARLERDGTLPRERFMARAIAAELAARGLAASEAMVVCGGFHIFLDRADPVAPPPTPAGTCLATVVPYSYFRVSELAGYGAANRAPRYYQAVWDHRGDQVAGRSGPPPGSVAEGQVAGRDWVDEPWIGAMVDHVTAVLGRGRKDGERLSSADAIAVTQHARLLASLRGRPAPILDDLRDALVSCCVKGRPEEEGHGLLKAMTATEVGSAVGRVTPALGRLPILHDFHAQLDDLELGEVMGRDQRLLLTLDLREDQGARRSAFLHRLRRLEVELGTLEGGATGDGTRLFREKWRLAWTPQVEPQLIERNHYGDTVEAAALARLEEDVAKAQRHAGETARLLRDAVTMQLPHVVRKLAGAVAAAIDEDRRFASQAEALVHLLVLDRMAIQRDLGRDAIAELAARAYTRACLAIGEVVGVPPEQQEPTLAHLKALAEAALSDTQDRALFTAQVRVAAAAATLPFMQGALAGILTELREVTPEELAQRVAAFAASPPARMVLAGEFLDGAFAVSKTSLLLGADALIAAIDELLRAAPWEDFLVLLPRVRHAFERLHERQRLAFADRVAGRYGVGEEARLDELPSTSAAAAVYLASLDARVAAIMKDWTF